jgi:DNA-binding protein HU-beta/integration host factor subunit beta
MGNVTKKNLVEVIAGRTGLTQVDIKVIIENLLETISVFLVEGKNIEIRGFGRFKVKTKKGRLARNPRTGETVQVGDGLKPVFEASKELKKRVNSGSKDDDSSFPPVTQTVSTNPEPIY